MIRFLLLVVLLAPCGGCLQLGYHLFGVGCTESPRYRGHSADQVWDTLQKAVNDYYDIRLADDEERYLETEWNEHLGPMSRMGRRLRVRAWIREEDETGAPYIEVTVDREINTNFEHPLSSSDADWEPDYDADCRDISREHRLIALVNLQIREIKPSREILENRPSAYRQSPEEKAKEGLWGRQTGPPSGDGPDEDLWKEKE